MTHEILEPLVDADASRAGFEENETVTMEDMLYGGGSAVRRRRNGRSSDGNQRLGGRLCRSYER